MSTRESGEPPRWRGEQSSLDSPPRHAARLFEAQEQGATEQRRGRSRPKRSRRCTSRTAAAAPANWRRSASRTSSTSSSTCRGPFFEQYASPDQLVRARSRIREGREAA